MRKTVFTAGLLAGYVLGTRAGRERYEAIARTATRVRSSQTVQSAAGVLREQAGAALHRLPTDSVLQPLRDRVEAARRRVPGLSPTGPAVPPAQPPARSH